MAKKQITISEAEKFAESVSVDISVLAGRFAHDKLVSWKMAARLCKKVALPEPQLNLVS